ncbi:MULTISPECIES: ATP-binding protein [unclassified Treponema]|uniref:ATP-binding protein n=1 Tax=unclassified Treponema TaxID=2638727 RepID=UPI0020A3DA2F|nr:MULTISPECIES: ATP-binding protein [unclassified Treponema]UTC67412.1 ATP-binding protein [Treponema sp. OMZ 789]UTC70140.1 ATP-binding protein [Treponema sp. OMZ 790]UTC72855.1 ATP-binding protein [Treponema sp. OMZ 791]
MNTRKMPIGVQSFEDLRSKDFVYIDKTESIWKLVHGSKVHFLSRPRRFGKSLLLSTLKAYFLGQKELFKGLAIEKLEEGEKEKREIWQHYPMLYMDFNLSKYETREDLESLLNYHLCNWEEVYGSKDSEQTFSERFAGLILRTYEKTGKQAVILIDEYDKPLLQTMWKDEDLNETYRTILKGFYGVIKSSDQYVRFAFLTGVTKFSKVSIFSDLNNLRDLSLLSDYSAICGISQEELEAGFRPEIEALAEKNNLSYEETLTKLKQRYDGYKFSEDGKNMYNPFSLLNVFAAGKMRDYWFATGTPTFLVDYLKKAYYNIPDLDGNVKMNEAGLETYRAETLNPLPILFQSGYLTIKDYDSDFELYRLGFPNDEVRYGFLDNLLPAYTSITYDKTGFSVMEFTKAVREGDVDGFMQKMKGIISGIPYDNLTEKDLALREQNYQTAVYLIFALMNQFVHTEVHCATGRADCIVELKDKVYIFEFKLASNGTAEDALQQIKEKSYAGKYLGSDKKIIAVGSSFDEEKRTIKDWVIDHLYN